MKRTLMRWGTALAAIALLAQPAVAAPGQDRSSGAGAATVSSASPDGAADLEGKFYVQNVVSGFTMSAGGDRVATQAPRTEERAQR